MKLESNEIEMQTYSMSYQLPPSASSSNNLDGDNPSGLRYIRNPLEDLRIDQFDDPLDFEEDKETIKEEEKMGEDFLLMQLSEDNFADSPSSLESFSTEGPSSLNSKSPGSETIDQKLDFILDSVKKVKKKSVSKAKTESTKKLIRKRKTMQQLQLLQQGIHEGDAIDKNKISALAAQTGLKEGQIYKWYWDYRRKLAK